jgi:hypothetical protein
VCEPPKSLPSMMEKVGGGSGERGCKILQIVKQFLLLHSWIANWWYYCTMQGVGSW